MKYNELLGKKIGVLGLGITGKSFVEYIGQQNVAAIWDDKGIQDDISKWQSLDYIFVSPGIPLDYPKKHTIIEVADKHNIKLLSDIDLFFANSKGRRFIGVTGTNGKSTTVALLAHILKAHECGNIGVPVLDLIADSKATDKYVIELSSFQIDLIQNNQLDISILLNVSIDHLDRYKDIYAYTASKKKIFDSLKSTNQKIINVDDEICAKLVNGYQNMIPISTTRILNNGFSYVDGKIYNNSLFKSKRSVYEVAEFDNLKGIHNKLNILAAVVAALIEGIEIEDALELTRSFKSLSHRLENVGEFEDITFINDSKATNAHAAKFALESFENIYWLAGGKAKQDDFSELDLGIKNVTKAYFYGADKEKLNAYAKAKNLKTEIFENIDEAFAKAVQDAKLDTSPQKYILLAPSCASLDQFQNYAKRGEKFVQLVQQYTKIEAA